MAVVSKVPTPELTGAFGKPVHIEKITQRAEEFVDGAGVVFQEIYHPEWVFLWPARFDPSLKVKMDSDAYIPVKEEDLKRLGIKVRGYQTDGEGNIVYGENRLFRMQRQLWNEIQNYEAAKSLNATRAIMQKAESQVAKEIDRTGMKQYGSEMETYDNDKNYNVVKAQTDTKQREIKKLTNQGGS